MPGCLFQGLGRKGLSEKNHIRLQNPPTALAGRRLFASPSFVEDFLQGKPLIAVQAADPAHAAVEFVDFFRSIARLLVEVVNVLGDDAVEFPQGLQLGNSSVGGVGVFVFEHAAVHQKAPMLMPRLGTGDVPVNGEILLVESRPEPSGTAEIGNPGFRTDPRTGKNDNASSPGDHLSHPNDVLFLIRCHHAAPLSTCLRRLNPSMDAGGVNRP
jgi:hypothetical protein